MKRKLASYHERFCQANSSDLCPTSFWFDLIFHRQSQSHSIWSVRLDSIWFDSIRINLANSSGFKREECSNYNGQQHTQCEWVMSKRASSSSLEFCWEKLCCDIDSQKVLFLFQLQGNCCKLNSRIITLKMTIQTNDRRKIEALVDVIMLKSFSSFFFLHCKLKRFLQVI